MMHKTRQFSIKPATPEEIAADMQRATWCLCNGYSVEHNGKTYLVLNDSTSEDSTAEYAVYHVLDTTPTGYLAEQQESLTFGWMEPQELPAELRQAFEYREWLGAPREITAQPYREHRCYRCA
jgi:hypothetical protein